MRSPTGAGQPSRTRSFTTATTAAVAGGGGGMTEKGTVEAFEDSVG
ncbi:hypothetical protein [Pseudarthrobacter sp. NamE5]|nr:hypothetical protein [Pseudarthrobacter sp. NamE5]